MEGFQQPELDTAKLDSGALTLAPGYIIAERYRVVSLLGHGGMGVVYRVEQIFLKKDFALKTLDLSNMSDQSWRRFQKEAEAISRLDHQNIIRVHDFGVIEGSQPFYVMDLLDGESLSSRLKAGPLAVQQATKIFIQICFALAHAHERGIIHRDIKPSNIMLIKGDLARSSTSFVKIVDFGISKLAEDSEGQQLTRTGEIFGSPLYMSPEQCLGTSVDQRTDIYSVGCALFEALTGTPPHIGDTALTTMMKHKEEAAPTLQEASLGKEFPDSLEQVVAHMLEKDREHRYQDFTNVAYDLMAIEAGKSIHASVAPNSVLKEADKTRSWAVPILIGTLVLVLLVFAYLVATGKVLIASAPEKKSNLNDTIADVNLVEEKFLRTNAFFSTIDKDASGKEIRTFHFPSLGFPIGVVATGVLARPIQAAGAITFPNLDPIAFKPSAEFCERTVFFSRFRADEIAVIEISGLESAGKNLGPYLKDWTNLEYLLAENSKIDDDVLDSVSHLPKLRFLRITNTDVTANGITRMANLQKLNVLEAGWIPDGAKILRALSGSTALTELSLWQTGLLDQDLATLRKLKSLKSLNISRNSKLTDHCLQYLVSIPNLERLQLEGCAITSKCIPYLQKLKLTELYINCESWKPEDQAALQKALPKTHIVFRAY